jgi:hypothetical protein
VIANTRSISRREFAKTSLAASLAGLGAGLLLTGSRLTSPARAAERKPKIVVEWTRKIYSSAGEKRQYNSFTNMAFWKGRYYVVFRQAVHHGVSESGTMLLQSDDLKKWTAKEIVNTEYDDRDPKLMATDGRLFVYSDAYMPGAVDQMMLTYTDDGDTWSMPRKIYKESWQLWKPKPHKRAYYVAADCFTCGRKSELLKSTDGINWESIGLITDKNIPTETAITFLPDDRILAVIRQNIAGHPPGFAIAEPPYTDWKLSSGKGHFSGPAIDVVGDTVIVASRTLLEDWNLPSEAGLDHQRTALYTFNVESMSLELQAILPTETGGDSSYPGIQPIGKDRALVCWYDGSTDWHHPSPSNIWLAEIRVQQS